MALMLLSSFLLLLLSNTGFDRCVSAARIWFGPKFASAKSLSTSSTSLQFSYEELDVLRQELSAEKSRCKQLEAHIAALTSCGDHANTNNKPSCLLATSMEPDVGLTAALVWLPVDLHNSSRGSWHDRHDELGSVSSP